MKTLIYISCFFLLLGCTSQNSLKIATSANMQFAMDEIVLAFEDEYKFDVDLVVSSSGKLTAQIEQGAPFDVFVAANMKYPQSLYKKGFSKTKPKVYGYGKLALWTLKDITLSLDVLTNESIKKIAIANPKTAPYGEVAIAILKENDIYEQVKDKLVYGESISQVNQFVTTKSADVGFTSVSVVLSHKIRNEGNYLLFPESESNRIAQGAVLLKNSSNKVQAKLFYDFLFSDKSQNILKKHGYLVPQ